MNQLSLTDPPAGPVTSTDAAMLFHWIEGGVSPSGAVAPRVDALFASALGSLRPFDGPPDPYRKYWRDSRTRKALLQLEEEGSVRYQEEHDGTQVWATDEGRRRYGSMNLNTHLKNRSKHAC